MGIIFHWRSSTVVVSCMCLWQLYLSWWWKKWSMVGGKLIDHLLYYLYSSFRSKIADFYCFSIEKRQLEKRASMLNARTTHGFHIFDEKILGKYSGEFPLKKNPSEQSISFSYRWVRRWWQWHVIHRKLQYSIRSMDDYYIDSRCCLQDMATIVGHRWSTNLHLSFSYIEFIYRHARRLLLWFKYSTME